MSLMKKRHPKTTPKSKIILEIPPTDYDHLLTIFFSGFSEGELEGSLLEFHRRQWDSPLDYLNQRQET